MATADEIKSAIGESAKAGIKMAVSDGVAVTAMSIDEQIKAERHLADSAAIDRPHRGMRFTKLRSPGTA